MQIISCCNSIISYLILKSSWENFQQISIFRTVKIMDTEDFLDLEHPAIELQGFLSICSRNLDRTVDVSIKK